MAPSEVPLENCTCPKWATLPSCLYHSNLLKLITTDVNASHSPVDLLNKPIIWVLGGPGAGKGTQCERIVAKYGFTHLSTGDLLRAEVKEKGGSERAKFISEIMTQGGLVPTEIALDLLKEAIMAKIADTNGFLVDGFPREICQAVAFEEAIGPPTAILYFEASEATLYKRLLGRAANSDRLDDNETTIKLRLKTFIENHQDVQEQYNDKISRIDAECSVDDVFAEVVKVLDPLVDTCVGCPALDSVRSVNVMPISN